MLIALQMVPVILSLLVLAAHFLRSGPLLLVPVLIVVVSMCFVRRPWAGRTVQVVLAVGALEWGRTAVVIARQRLAAGEPWIRMGAILAIVAVVAVLSLLLMGSGRMRGWFRTDILPGSDPRGAPADDPPQEG